MKHPRTKLTLPAVVIAIVVLAVLDVPVVSFFVIVPIVSMLNWGLSIQDWKKRNRKMLLLVVALEIPNTKIKKLHVVMTASSSIFPACHPTMSLFVVVLVLSAHSCGQHVESG